MIKILAIPGSLRHKSSSNLILQAIVSSAPVDVRIEIYDGVAGLPHFDDPEVTPAPVVKFREKIKQSDAILICTPEYAFGIPGSLKNALDWTVGSGELMNKPVAFITASSQGEKGHAALLLVLTALSADIVDNACLLIPFVRTKLDSAGRIKDDELVLRLRNAMDALVAARRIQ
jgi:NAD(P)H-dependent FMN reductase